MVATTQVTDSSALFASFNKTPGTTAASSAATTQQDSFMRLLVTQLKNQDPLNPMDNAQMTSQMAQISTVSGIEKLNVTLQALSASLTPNQTLQAAGMIGHGVMVAGNGVDLTGGVGLGGFELSGRVDAATVSIYDKAGALVRNIDLGAQPAGIVKWQWDGLDASGAAMKDGQYTFAVNAVLAGNNVAASNYQFGMVNNVTQGTQGVMLSVGAQDNVALSQVKQIF